MVLNEFVCGEHQASVWYTSHRSTGSQYNPPTLAFSSNGPRALNAAFTMCFLFLESNAEAFPQSPSGVHIPKPQCLTTGETIEHIATCDRTKDSITYVDSAMYIKLQYATKLDNGSFYCILRRLRYATNSWKARKKKFGCTSKGVRYATNLDKKYESSS